MNVDLFQGTPLNSDCDKTLSRRFPTKSTEREPDVFSRPRAHLFEARRHAPAAGLHDAVVAPHVLADLPVLLPPLLSAGQQRRVAEERRNTVTGQSGSNGREEREEGGGEEGQALAGRQQRETQRKIKQRLEKKSLLAKLSNLLDKRE